jgi:hypothetical protein
MKEGIESAGTVLNLDGCNEGFPTDSIEEQNGSDNSPRLMTTN